MAARELRIFGIGGIGEIGPGDEVGRLIAEAARAQGTPLEQGDVLVVSQKAVSKAEGRVMELSDVEPSPFARRLAEQHGRDPRVIEVVLNETRRIVRMDRGVLIAETPHGFVCANAGVDASNQSRGEQVSLLPRDPDASARRLRVEVERATGVEAAVIVADTFGRPWREGTTEVAVGVAGMEPLLDYRGRPDACGRLLRVTVVAVADELASASELVRGKADGIPAAAIRGYRYPSGDGPAGKLVRNPERDLFR